MKLTALMVITTTRMVTAICWSLVRPSVVPWGAGSQVTSAPLHTRITPAATCPASLLIAPMPQRSSTKPMTTTRPPASSRPLAMSVSANTLLREGSWLATTSPATSPAYMANPPSRGVGTT